MKWVGGGLAWRSSSKPIPAASTRLLPLRPMIFRKSATLMVAAPCCKSLWRQRPIQDALRQLRQPGLSIEPRNRRLSRPPKAAYQTEYVPTPDTPSIAEMAANYSPDASFQPPPRPEIDAYVPIDDKTDPAISLFNALQIVRERQAASFHPPAVKINSSRKPLFKMPSAKIEEMTKEVTKKITRIRESLPLPEQIPPQNVAGSRAHRNRLGCPDDGSIQASQTAIASHAGLSHPGQWPQSRQPAKPRSAQTALPPPTSSAPREPRTGRRSIIHPGADNFADHIQNRPDNAFTATAGSSAASQPQPYQDPNNPYPQDANGRRIRTCRRIATAECPSPAASPPQAQFDQYGNPIHRRPSQPGFDAQGNPLPGYEPNQVPQPGQPGAPGQDTFNPPNLSSSCATHALDLSSTARHNQQ